MNSVQRVKTLLAGELPDRPPLYDVIRNDAVIEHFAGEKLTPDNALEVVARAHSRALDETKAWYGLPSFNPGDVVTDERGVATLHQRWNSWTGTFRYPSTEEYVRAKSQRTAEPWDWSEDDRIQLERATAEWLRLAEISGDIGRDFDVPGPPRLDEMFPEVGLEQFCYYMADCPKVIERQVRYRFEKIRQAIERAQLPENVATINEACDIAHKTGLLFSPGFLQPTLVQGMRKLCAAVHQRGLRVMFHSDGNLWKILDGLVDAGIDLLHPVELLAGMDPDRLHQRYPELILVGTIDVSQLLPFGTRQEIADQVQRNIEVTEGRIMIGSSTEIHNDVPLANYLALHEAVLDYTY